MNFLAFQAGTASVGITALFVWPWIGRQISQSELGTISGCLAVASIAAPLLTMALHLTLANHFSHDPGSKRNTEGRVAFSWTLGLAATSIILSLANYSGVLVIDVVALSAASAVSLMVTGTTRGLNAPGAFALATFVSQIGGLIVLGFGLAVGSLHVGVVLYVLFSAVGLIIQTVLVGQNPFRRNYEGALALLRRSSRLVPHLILAVVLLMTMRLLVGAIEGPSALGQFQYASLLIGAVTTFASTLDAHWSVRAQAERTSEGLSQRLSEQQTRVQMTLVVVTLVSVAFCAFGLRFWLPSGYPIDSIRLAVLLALPAGAFQAFADGKAAFAMWHSANGMVSRSTVIGVASALLSGLFLVSLGGWPLVGLALLIGSVIRAGVIWVSAKSLPGFSRFPTSARVLIIVQIVISIISVLTFRLTD
ncbi:lipopolysaccharide biosynthesis protein [Frondihabitans sp. Leaf304]|uniref:lipopolysaccharide biosynthesis protein n=1 Tax=Frondihabitans sp. Leaf304 TaxID=1736329 RepID=UPI0012FCDA18|nr:hypothetical protein [Frondihabitans sp. Leaf304]